MSSYEMNSIKYIITNNLVLMHKILKVIYMYFLVFVVLKALGPPSKQGLVD